MKKEQKETERRREEVTWLDRVTAWLNGIKRDRENGRGKTWRRKSSADSLYEQERLPSVGERERQRER